MQFWFKFHYNAFKFQVYKNYFKVMFLQVEIKTTIVSLSMTAAVFVNTPGQLFSDQQGQAF